MLPESGSYWLVRFGFQPGLALVYARWNTNRWGRSGQLPQIGKRVVKISR